MNLIPRSRIPILAAAALLLPIAGFAQNTAPTASKDQWIHVRVESKDNQGETVRVNVPIEMAEKVLPAIHNKELHDGKVRIDSAHTGDVDLRAILEAVKTSRDGEYVTVQGSDDDVRVAKNAGYLYIHVTEKAKKGQGKDASTKGSKVEVKVPMKVVDALLSSGDNEINIVAGLACPCRHWRYRTGQRQG